MQNRVKVHDEALDKLFCGQLAYEVDKLARKDVYGESMASKLTFHELLAEQTANAELQGLCNEFRALGLNITLDVEPCLKSLKTGRVLLGHPEIENFQLHGRSVEDVLKERFPDNAAIMVEIIRAIQNKYSRNYTRLATLTL